MKISRLLPLLRVFSAAVDAAIDASEGEKTCTASSSSSSSCNNITVVQIATLNSSPRRCIHIEAPLPPQINPDDATNNNMLCQNYPDWFDGTNGCDAYVNDGWCIEYGNLSGDTFLPAIEACCICGGGTYTPRSESRLQIGEYVKLTNQFGQNLEQCKSIKIVEITAYETYNIQIMKACGPMGYRMSGNGQFMPHHQWPTGTQLSNVKHEPDRGRSIVRHIKVELKKCRSGLLEQEFEISHVVVEDDDDGSDDDERVMIYHPLSGVSLSSALDSNSKAYLNISQVWDDGLFDGSGDYYFIKLNYNEGEKNADGSDRPPDSFTYLANGRFGEKEYSEVETKSNQYNTHFYEEEGSMWQFRPVIKMDDDVSNNVIDEHAQWLEKITNIIGIDYLTQLAPWHLLDVERESTKGEVKSRFRELSRIFHPDKLLAHQSEKKELFGRIFILLQNAYQGLKSANEAEKERFRIDAESSSQLFTYSQHVVELLPYHWTKLDNSSDSSRYILNVASHLNSTLLNNSTSGEEEETEPSVQLWITFMYSSRCGMSRMIVGMVDLAARHLANNENIKVGGYRCRPNATSTDDPLGLQTDPICSQFNRFETPNVHLIVETIPGRRRNENGDLVDVYPDRNTMLENAMFKHFYSEVPNGNSTQFFPHNFIEFAVGAKKTWEHNHLVHRMTKQDFSSPEFIDNVSIVAYLDGTGNDKPNMEVVDAIQSSLPGVARRFLNDTFYVGIALCGVGDEEVDDEKNLVDCSIRDVSFLPDIKVYKKNSTESISLLRGKFSDMRDVQIALESMGNILRLLHGGVDDYDEKIDEIPEIDETNEGGGDCGNQQQPPPPPHDYQEIDGRMEETPLLGMKEDASEQTKPALEAGTQQKMPKLARSNDRSQLSGGRDDKTSRDRISSFTQRKTGNAGGGALLGGGGGGSAGLLT